jgi:hypothetical protein
MNLSIDHENLSGSEEKEITALRDELIDHPVVQRVVDRIGEGADQASTGHTSHSSHSTHATHSSGWLSPKR